MPSVFEDSSPCAKTRSVENGRVKEKEEEDGCTFHRSALERTTPLWYKLIQIFFECRVAVASSGCAVEGTN